MPVQLTISLLILAGMAEALLTLLIVSNPRLRSAVFLNLNLLCGIVVSCVAFNADLTQLGLAFVKIQLGSLLFPVVAAFVFSLYYGTEEENEERDAKEPPSNRARHRRV